MRPRTLPIPPEIAQGLDVCSAQALGREWSNLYAQTVAQKLLDRVWETGRWRVDGEGPLAKPRCMVRLVGRLRLPFFEYVDGFGRVLRFDRKAWRDSWTY